MLAVGDDAPEFSLKDSHGTFVSLRSFKGKNVVLYFYPKDDTPGCTAEACSFRDNFSVYTKKGIVVLGISMDEHKSHQKFIEKYKLPFTLLCDPLGDVCLLYDAYGKKKTFGIGYKGILRKTFLIDKAGKIKYIFDKVKCEEHAREVLKIFEDG